MKKIFIIVLVLFICGQIRGQGKAKISTDRPSQSESTVVIPVKKLQLETGFAFEKVNDRINNTTYNSSVFRYGLVENVELRLGLQYLGTEISLDGGDIDENGFGPITIGGKFFLKEESETMPALAFLTTLFIPNSGSSAFENNNLGADFRLNADYSLNEGMALGANLGVIWSGKENEDYAIGFYSTVIDISLNEKLNVFAELYGYLPGEGKNDHRWNGGLTYAVNADLQLDFSTGLGLSEVSPDFFISLGLSIRMP